MDRPGSEEIREDDFSQARINRECEAIEHIGATKYERSVDLVHEQASHRKLYPAKPGLQQTYSGLDVSTSNARHVYRRQATPIVPNLLSQAARSCRAGSSRVNEKVSATIACKRPHFNQDLRLDNGAERRPSTGQRKLNRYGQRQSARCIRRWRELLDRQATDRADRSDRHMSWRSR